jgi:hypothetical protein
LIDERKGAVMKRNEPALFMKCNLGVALLIEWRSVWLYFLVKLSKRQRHLDVAIYYICTCPPFLSPIIFFLFFFSVTYIYSTTQTGRRLDQAQCSSRKTCSVARKDREWPAVWHWHQRRERLDPDTNLPFLHQFWHRLVSLLLKIWE